MNLTPDEAAYVDRAIKAGVQSTEILNVLIITKIAMMMKHDLVKAMEEKDYKVYPISATDVQTLYTQIKVDIQQVWRNGSGLVG